MQGLRDEEENSAFILMQQAAHGNKYENFDLGVQI